MCNTHPAFTPAGLPIPRPGLRASLPPARLTRNQALVLAAMRTAPGRAMAAYEVLARLEPAGVKGPQSVYRALQALVEAGLAHRIESLNAFTLCAHQHAHAGCTPAEEAPRHRPAFLVCRHCRSVEEIADPGLLGFGEAFARRGFRVEQRVLEMVGACTGCDTAAAGEPIS
jgi:Fur family zinc uptake transcriptional regulator